MNLYDVKIIDGLVCAVPYKYDEVWHYDRADWGNAVQIIDVTKIGDYLLLMNLTKESYGRLINYHPNYFTINLPYIDLLVNRLTDDELKEIFTHMKKYDVKKYIHLLSNDELLKVLEDGGLAIKDNKEQFRDIFKRDEMLACSFANFFDDHEYMKNHIHTQLGAVHWLLNTNGEYKEEMEEVFFNAKVNKRALLTYAHEFGTSEKLLKMVTTPELAYEWSRRHKEDAKSLEWLIDSDPKYSFLYHHL